MIFTPTRYNNIRVSQRDGMFWIDQAYLQPRQGRNDYYTDLLADTTEVGEEDWTYKKPFSDFNECIATCINVMFEDDVQLRSVDMTGVSYNMQQRAIAMLEQVIQ